MAHEELLLPGVRHDGRTGALRALAREILFTEAGAEVVRHDYTPAYTEERDERVGALPYAEVQGVERSGEDVRLRLHDGETTFTFERDADAESFAALVTERIAS